MSRLPVWAQALIVTLVSLVAGLSLLLWAAGLNDPLKSIAHSIAGIIMTSGLFSWWGAYQARIEVKRHFDRSLGLSEELEQSGIRSVGFWPINIPKGVTKVDMVVIRGHSWFKMQVTTLASIMRSSKTEIRICLVHPRSKVLPVLSTKFREPEDQVVSKILDTIVTIVKVAEDTRAKAEKQGESTGHLIVKCHHLIPTHTYYRFDDVSFTVWYGLKRGRTDVPLLKLEDGKLRQFFQYDFEELWNEQDTVLVYDSTNESNTSRQLLASIGLPQETLQSIFERG